MGRLHVVGQLDEYLTDTLPVKERERVEAHLCQCADCAQKLVALRRATALLPKVLAPPVVTGLADSVLERIGIEAAPVRERWFPLHSSAMAWSLAAVILVVGAFGLLTRQSWLPNNHYTNVVRHVEAPPVIPANPGKKPGLSDPSGTKLTDNPLVSNPRSKTTPNTSHLRPIPSPLPTNSHETPILIAIGQTSATVLTRDPLSAIAVRLDTKCLERLVKRLLEAFQQTPALASQVHRDGIVISPVTLKGIVSPTAQSVFDRHLQREFVKAHLPTQAKSSQHLEASASIARDEHGTWSWTMEMRNSDTHHVVNIITIACVTTPVAAADMASTSTIQWLITQIESQTLDTTAAEFLVLAGEPAANPVWRAFLRTKTRREAHTFAWILGQLKDQRLVTPLIMALRGLYAEEAADALAAYGNQAFPALEHAVTSISDGVARLRVVKLLAMLPGRDATRTLIEALDDPVPWVQQQAAFALADRKAPEAVETLVILCHSTDGSVRLQAVTSLMTYQQPGHHPILKELLLHDVAPEVRIAVARGLGDFYDPQVPAILVATFYDPALLKPGQDTILAAIIAALTRQGAHAVPALLEASRATDPDIRNLAITILKAIPGKEAQEALSNDGVKDE